MRGNEADRAWLHILDVRFAIAQNFISEGQIVKAEQLYRLTLQQFEGSLGKSSPLVGIVVMSMIDLYELQGKQNEIKSLWEQLRKIFYDLWIELKSLKDSPSEL